MPIDALGEAVGEVVGAVAEVALEAATEPPKRGRVRRILYWSVVALVASLLAWVAYLALS